MRTRSWERRLQRQRQFDFRLQNTLGARHEQSRADSTGSVWYLYQRQTPSEYLFEALRTLNQHQEFYMAKPEHKKVDLSWIHPKRLREEKAIYWAKGNKSKRLLSNIPPLKLVTRPPRRSLMTILAEYIRDVEPYLQRRVLDKPPKAVRPDVMQSFHDALLNTFNKHSLKYLSERGYTVTDVVTWAWILTGKTSLHSAKRYAAVEEHARQTDTSSSRLVARPLPPSLLLFLLRRTDIDAKALRLYILQAANLLSSSSRPPTSASKKQGARHDWDPYNGPDTTMVLIIRLIRAARIVWPAALVSVSNLVTSVYGFDAIMKHYDGNVDLDLRRALVERYNKILALLSLACNISPFNSSGIQQSAQFHLLREMTKFTPPLVVNRMGFQAITRVQVTHARTESENDWARSQRKSWPPWKETRLGIDPEKGEGSESRAVRAISYMVSAGEDTNNHTADEHLRVAV
ncbi:hypothetical protein KEM55_003599 [Ascosphaera atra]|nr:hypothetical protein KEM55_003599 [Ascosphaera atra]